MKKVSISFFNSKNVEDDILKINSSSADYIHVDVGDGLFIERKFHPIKELNELNGALTKRLDVHLMVEDPDKYIDDYVLLNTEYIEEENTNDLSKDVPEIFFIEYSIPKEFKSLFILLLQIDDEF